MLICSVGGVETVTLLLKKGANADVQDRSGTTALHLAARNGSVYNGVHTYAHMCVCMQCACACVCVCVHVCVLYVLCVCVCVQCMYVID